MTTIHPPTPHPEDFASPSRRLALALAQAADDRKGGDLLILNVEAVSYLADYFVIVTGYSRTQVRALADAMQTAAQEQCDRTSVAVEGQSESNWIVLDYGEVIVHVMTPEVRQFYNLEAFWGHAQRVPFPSPSLADA